MNSNRKLTFRLFYVLFFNTFIFSYFLFFFISCREEAKELRSSSSRSGILPTSEHIPDRIKRYKQNLHCYWTQIDGFCFLSKLAFGLSSM